MNSTIDTTYISTSGHGYLRVDKPDFDKLKIHHLISEYSSYDREFYYLEHDCDMPKKKDLEALKFLIKNS